MHSTRPVHLALRRLVVVLLLLTGACTSWHVETLPPAQLVAEQEPDQVRVRLVDRQRFVLRMPAVLGDSLVGTQDGGTRSVALAEVNEIAVRRGNTLKSIGLVVGVVAGALLIIAIVWAIDCGGTCMS
jgi:hypothetical protein